MNLLLTCLLTCPLLWYWQQWLSRSSGLKH